MTRRVGDTLTPRSWEAAPDLACRQTPGYAKLPAHDRAAVCHTCPHRLPCYQLGVDVAAAYAIKPHPDDHATYGGHTLDKIARTIGGRR